jgi:hypothetical protein
MKQKVEGASHTLLVHLRESYGFREEFDHGGGVCVRRYGAAVGALGI